MQSFMIWFTEGILLRILGLALLLILYKFIRDQQTSPKSNPATRHNSETYTTCDGPNCLRCNVCSSKDKQLFVLEGLRKKFETKDLWRIDEWLSEAQQKPYSGKQKPAVFYLPHLRTSSVINRKYHTNDVDLLELSHALITEEYAQIAMDMSETSGWKVNSTPHGSWSVFYLINQGVRVLGNTDMCPHTMNILSQFNDLLQDCAFGNACFSVVQPNTLITGHYGPCNVRSRCHLGLKIPSGWRLNVEDVSLTWEEGKCLLFDDSFFHSVSQVDKKTVNSSFPSFSKQRVVFMVDFWHYNITKPERTAISALFPSH